MEGAADVEWTELRRFLQVFVTVNAVMVSTSFC